MSTVQEIEAALSGSATAGLRQVFGGTPNTAGETPALPETKLTHFQSHPVNLVGRGFDEP